MQNSNREKETPCSVVFHVLFQHWRNYFKKFFFSPPPVFKGEASREKKRVEKERMAVIRWRKEASYGAHASRVVSSEWFEGVEGRRGEVRWRVMPRGGGRYVGRFN